MSNDKIVAVLTHNQPTEPPNPKPHVYTYKKRATYHSCFVPGKHPLEIQTYSHLTFCSHKGRDPEII